VIAAARRAGCERILVVVGHGAEAVRAAFAGQDDLVWVEQRDQRGTGHALLQAEPHVRAPTRLLLVLSGDVPLVRAETLAELAEAAERGWGALAVADARRAGSLGRVLADGRGGLRAIVEARDASPEELALDPSTPASTPCRRPRSSATCTTSRPTTPRASST
jgi:bifunctional UDP-N-acetylglucosamine pyrophosphorylase / glucosamine-1-phosphate N-acetyltransferase